MSTESTGIVSKRDGKLVMSVSAKTAREKFPSLIKLLALKQVDLVEVKNRETVVGHITAPPDSRLPTGEFKIK